MPSDLLQQIELAASRGESAPPDLQPPEIMLYHMLTGLYATYHAGQLTKSQGHERKQQIYSVYSKLAAEYKQFTDICAEYQKRLHGGYSVGDKRIIP